MPVARFQMSDGRIGRFEVPEGTTPEQAQELITQHLSQKPELAKAEFNREMLGPDTLTLAERFGGVVRGARDVVDAGAQLMVRGANAIGLAPESEINRVDQINKTAEQDYRQNWLRGINPGLDIPRVAGNIVATAPLMSVLPSSSATLTKAVLSGAGAGGVQGALTPVDVKPETNFLKEKGKQILTGSAFGGGTAGIAYGVSKVVNPTVRPEVKALMDEGVTPTPGQIIGGKVQRIEEGATSIPIMGDSIKKAQVRAVQDFDRAAINRALKPIGQELPKDAPVGHETIAEAGDKISNAYDSLLPKLKVVADQTFNREISTVQQMATNLPETQAKQFDKILQNEVLGKFTEYGRMSGESMKEVESKLGLYIRRYSRSENPDHQMLGDALQETQAILRRMVNRGNPEYAGQLSKINEAYANLLRVENAAARMGSKEGVFTPAGLRGAVRQMDPSLRKRAFAQGGALMQDLAENGVNVLGQTVPDSGTPFRAANMAMAAESIVRPEIPIAAAGGGVLYSKPAQKLASILLTQRPEVAEPISNMIRLSSPYLGAGAASYRLSHE